MCTIKLAITLRPNNLSTERRRLMQLPVEHVRSYTRQSVECVVITLLKLQKNHETAKSLDMTSCIFSTFWSGFSRSYCATRSMIGYWHDTVVCLSVCLSVCL